MIFNNPEVYKEELTFDDVFLFQQESDISSRTEVIIQPESPLSTTIPIISSNMNSVTGKRMCEKLARLGGLGVLPQDMDIRKMIKDINYVHNADLRLDNPLTVTKNDRVIDALGIINKRSHQAVIMINNIGKPISIIKNSDLEGKDKHTKLKDIQKRPLIIGKDDISDEEAFNIMEDNGISSLPIVDKGGILIGVLTRDDGVRNSIYSPALNKKGKLDIAVALSVNGYKDKIKKIIKSGVNIIFLDTAHGYTKKMINTIDEIKNKYNDIIIVAGNIMDSKGAEALIKAGANGVKVGIGPGAMCTTRMMTGVGRPQFSAIVDCALAARENGGFVIADGGIKYPRDLNLALAAGATHGMLGTLLAGTFESPGDIIDSNGEKYKQCWGMASGKAVNGRNQNLSNFERAKRERFEEGISDAKIYNPKPLGDVIDNFTTGLTSAMTYSGARDLEEFYHKAVVGVQTNAGFSEGTPHGKVKR